MTQQTSPAAAPTFTLKFKKEFYEAAPHLYDAAPIKDKNFTAAASEVYLHCCGIGQEPPAGHFLCKNPDGVRWYFIQSSDPKAHKFDAFKEALAVQCQQEPILCDQDGNVLDGFVRWLACVKLGIVPVYQIANAHLPDDSAKISWIRSRKLARHNLTERQRMEIVVAEIKAHPERSNSWTAELLGVSRNTVIKYRERLEKGGDLQNVTRRLNKNGQEEEYSPAKPPTEEQIKERKEEAKERSKTALMNKAKAVLGENLLQPDALDRSLSNIRKYLESVHVPEYRQDGLKAVKAVLDKKLPPMHEENLGEQYALTVLRKIEDYLKTAGDLSNHTPALLKVRDLIDKQIPAVALEKHASTTISATATWEVKAHDAKKTKKGVFIDIDPKQMPDEVDVARGVKPGQIIVNGKVITFEAAKALLLLPPVLQDATVTSEPPSEDDLMTKQAAK